MIASVSVSHTASSAFSRVSTWRRAAAQSGGGAGDEGGIPITTVVASRAGALNRRPLDGTVLPHDHAVKIPLRASFLWASGRCSMA
jgi:hypothetical protein